MRGIEQRNGCVFYMETLPDTSTGMSPLWTPCSKMMSWSDG